MKMKFEAMANSWYTGPTCVAEANSASPEPATDSIRDFVQARIDYLRSVNRTPHGEGSLASLEDVMRHIVGSK